MPADLLAELARDDPATLARIDAQNPARLRRAWEVLRATGRPLSDGKITPSRGLPCPWPYCLPLLLDANREWLAERRIATRFDRYARRGRAVRRRGPTCRAGTGAGGARKAIGAPELIAHLRGEMTLDPPGGPRSPRRANKITGGPVPKRQRNLVLRPNAAPGRPCRSRDGETWRSAAACPCLIPPTHRKPCTAMFRLVLFRVHYRVLSLGKLRMRDPWRDRDAARSGQSSPLLDHPWAGAGHRQTASPRLTGRTRPCSYPPGCRMALELPSQMQGLNCACPPTRALGLPERPFPSARHQHRGAGKLTSHLEKIEREIAAQAPAMERAMAGYGLLSRPGWSAN